MCHVFSLRARFIIPAEYSCFPRSRLFPTCICPGQFFFVCEHPQIHSLRRIILLIRYSQFYALRIFPIDYRYFNDVNSFQNFNNYSSGIYLDRRLYAVFSIIHWNWSILQMYGNIILSDVSRKILYLYKNLLSKFFCLALIVEEFDKNYFSLQWNSLTISHCKQNVFFLRISF